MNMKNMKRIIFESIKSGILAALVMMPFGIAFRLTELRIGYYAPKFAGIFVDNPGPPFLFTQHILIGWISATPLIVFFMYGQVVKQPIVAGMLYGILYYILINSVGLPLFFGDPLPWQLGITIIIPSLVIHIVFGGVVGFFSRKLVEANRKT